MRRSIVVGTVSLAAAALAPGAVASADPDPVVITVKPWTYLPAPIHVPQGRSLKFLNMDPISGQGHSVTDSAERTEHLTRFSSPVLELGKSAEVTGVQKLPPGTYRFICRVHPFMQGTLIIDAP